MSFSVIPRLPQGVDPPDVYYTDAYARLGAQIETEPAEPIVLAYKDAGGEIYMQCLARHIEGGTYQDLTTPYGYGGPLLKGRPDSGRFVDELVNWAVSNRIVSAFVRFDPVRDNHRPFPSHTTFVSNVVLVPTADETEILNNLSPRYRKQYRRAVRDEMETTITYNLSREDVSEFRKYYEHSMDRVDAQKKYYFPDSFWDVVYSDQRELGASISRTTHGGVVHATALRLAHGRYGYNFLSATSDAGRRSHATEFDKINYCLHAQQSGRVLVNFGGGVGGGPDSLLEHKKRFAPNSAMGDFHVGKFVFLPDVYESLSGGAFVDAGPFPAYRFSNTAAK